MFRKILYFTVLLPVVFFSGQTLEAQDIKVHEQRKAQLEKDIELIDRQLSENESRSRSMLSRLTLLRTQISNRNALISESNRLIRKYADEIYLSQLQINRLDARIDTLTVHFGKLVRSAYRNRDAKVWYMYILASDNLGQAFRRYSYFKNLSSEMKRQAEDISRAKEELEERKAELQALKADAEKVKAGREKELASLQAEKESSEKVVAQLKRNRSRYEKELAAKRKEINALNRKIEKLIAEAMGTEGKSKEAEIDYALDAEFSKNKGKLPWPVDGVIVDRFGQHYHPVFTRVKLPFNNGISIAVAKGARVKAVFDGVVKQIVVMPGYNQCVLVQHGNWFSFYCKLQNTTVKAGDKVKTGQTIGSVDTINGDTQLHFQIWQKQTPQNPELWLRKK
ncbi:MAG: peptidoglycan DD-metalloendopeptidase family protein [Bacteroidetes bacterium]|uniref:Peptidoglycan DD-metalloendopeptidase family protein n=1 Tax=Candidatus Cryptobacteroides faecipullorum TaxID=2840764 RepID=A0A9D9NBI0_9BACT|nr:peptidoglycan DD-metalloendopeptidase family protein [Candidatus Cryptobacteroides faecipullorum]